MRTVSKALSLLMVAFVGVAVAVFLGHALLRSKTYLHMLVVSHEHRWVFYILRAILLGCFLLFWPTVIRRVSRHRGWSLKRTQTVVQARWRYALWFVFIDVLLHLL